MKKVLLLFIMLLALLFSGCSGSHYTNTEFCLKEGYTQGEANVNWIHAKAGMRNEFHCLDLKSKSVSKIYTYEDKSK